MIESNLQYEITKRHLKEFGDYLEAVKKDPVINPLLKEILINSTTSQMKSFAIELHNYEANLFALISDIIADVDSYTRYETEHNLLKLFTDL